MRLSSLADYAVVMMTAAARAGCGASMTATSLATRTAVPLATAQKLMQRLARAGLLTSARGTGGGFRLARPAAAINLADIIEAIEGPIAMTTCVDNSRDNCALDHHCAVKPHWGPVNSAVRGALAGVSLAQLAQEGKWGLRQAQPVRVVEAVSPSEQTDLVEAPPFALSTSTSIRA